MGKQCCLPIKSVIQTVADKVCCAWCVTVCKYVCTIDFFNSTDISYFSATAQRRNIVGTMSSQGKERMEIEAEEQVESPGDYEDDDIPDLSAFIPDDTQRREAWRWQKVIENLFCNPSNVQNDEEDWQEAMSLQIKKDQLQEQVHKTRCPENPQYEYQFVMD